MAKNSISSANVSFNITIPGVFSSGVLLQQWATDDMFDADPQTLTEARVGPDGFVVGGYVFNLTKLRLNFQANSPSGIVFWSWKSAQDSIRDVIAATAKIVSPALGLDVDLDDIYLGSVPLLPPHKKVAEPFSVELTVGPDWQTTST